MIRLIVCVCLFVSATAVAQQATPQQATPQASPAAKISDADITEAVESALLLARGLPFARINVAAKDGIVTLSGVSESILVKERAVEIAQTIRGVLSVIDSIDVRPAKRSDQEIQRDIIAALEADPAVNAKNITVSANDGVITLNGQVESWQREQMALNAAKSVRGIKSVQSKLEIERGEMRADRAVQADVNYRLQTDAWLSGSNVAAVVKNGAAHLSGIVGSAAAKARAQLLAAGVAGVTSVDASGLQVIPDYGIDARRQPPPLVRTDQDIKSAVEAALRHDPRVVPSEITIYVRNGFVRLSGTVGNLRAKQAAEEDARNTVGVWRVRNYLNVLPAQPPDDEVLARKVREALIRHPFLLGNRMDITVFVLDGRVTLSGTVESPFYKAAASRIVSSMDGVIDVQNDLKVRDGEEWTARAPYYLLAPRTEQDLKEDVEYQLRWNALVNANDVKVDVADGIVTLAGEVPSRQAFDAAEAAAWRAAPRHVRNRLSVKRID